MEKEYSNFMTSVTRYDPSKTGTLEGPFFSTYSWEEDHDGIHPVDMLAKIATFQGKSQASFEPYRKFRGKKGDQNFLKIVKCSYDSIDSFGNGKQEKQAKLVAARNMIVKLKKLNIGIVNETLAAGVTVQVNPHKKPITQQFKMFKKAGELGTFVPASSNGKTGAESAKLVDFKAQKEQEDKEYAEFKAVVENPDDTVKPATVPKIVFKRPANSVNDTNSEPVAKQARSSNNDGESEVTNSDNEVASKVSQQNGHNENQWNDDHYGWDNSWGPPHGYPPPYGMGYGMPRPRGFFRPYRGPIPHRGSHWRGRPPNGFGNFW